MAMFETIHGPEDVNVRKALGERLQKIAASRKMESGGAFGDTRGAYMILNVDSPSELRELLGLPILTNFHTECHPLESFEQVTAFFKKHESETEM